MKRNGLHANRRRATSETLQGLRQGGICSVRTARTFRYTQMDPAELGRHEPGEIVGSQLGGALGTSSGPEHPHSLVYI